MLSINEVSSLIDIGTEKIDLDYKESFNWDKSKKEDKYKLIKDILAMKNTKGGGRIIFGINDSEYSLTGLRDEDFISFDTTKVNDLLEQFTDPISYCNVYKYIIREKKIVVIDVPEFEEIPIICKRDANASNNKHILKAGQVYIRTRKASSENVSNSLQMRELIERAAPKLVDDIFDRYYTLINNSSYLETKQRSNTISNSKNVQNIGLNFDENLIVMYKPRVNLITGELVALEARVFLSNTMKELDFKTFEEYELEQLYRWYTEISIRELKDIIIRGINISSVVIKIDKPDILDKGILNILTQYDGNLLIISITENSITTNTFSIYKTVETLGANISLAEFGTGYTSLSYLKSIEAKELIVDQSFVKELNNEINKNIVSTILKLGDSLKMDVIADGVGNYNHLEVLTKQGYKIFQGDLFGTYQTAHEIINNYEALIEKVKELQLSLNCVNELHL